MSYQKSNLNKKLQFLLNQLSCYKKPKYIVLQQAIQERLDKSLKNYYNELCASIEYATTKNDIKMIKRLLKL